MLSRHGSRYPTLGANVKDLGDKVTAAKGSFKASGALAFLSDWEYKMGHEILVPKGECRPATAPATVLTLLLTGLL